jgi:actin-related protein
MDYIFLNMGIDSSIDHPIVMTEPIFNPSFSHGSNISLIL